MNRSQTIAFALLVLLALPASASAAIPPPPGNSAADQYAETFPGAGGNPTTAPPGTADPAGTLGSDTAREFQQAGSDGAQAAAVAAATAPKGRAGLPPGGREPGNGAEGGSGPIEVVKHGLGTSGSDGIGFLLPLILVAVVTAAVAFLVARSRQTIAE